MRRKLTIVLPCLLLAALVAGHTAAWFAASHCLAVGFDAWVAQRRAAGWLIEAGPPVRGGWPLAATLTVPDMAVSAGAAGTAGRVSWRGARVVLSLTATNPDRLGIDLVGDQSLRIAPWPEVPFSADLLHAEAPLASRGSTPVASLEVRTLHAPHLTIGLLTSQVSGTTDPKLNLSAEAIDLPPDMPWAFGPHISSLTVDATLHGTLPPPGTLQAMAASWRDAGGAIEISHFALGWGPLGLVAVGRMELDDQLQPAGTGDVHVIGYARSVDALAAQHLITKDTATAATAVLTLLSHVPQDGGASEVEVPLTLRNRKLSMGRVGLTRVPEVVWP